VRLSVGVAGKTKYRLAGIFFPDRPPNKFNKHTFLEYVLIDLCDNYFYILFAVC